MKTRKKSFSDILEDTRIRTRRKLLKKIPSWAGVEGLEFPSSLSLEQCSSEATATFKARLIKEKFAHPDTICDLTCGLGVDSWAFSAIASKVISFERYKDLAEAVRNNYSALKADNIDLRCEDVSSLDTLPECDLFYADPARRDSLGKKVFLLEDCSPDITAMMPLMLSKAPSVMLKLSPVADLTMLCTRLGRNLEDIHIVSVKSEVKELLCILGRAVTDRVRITASELDTDGSPIGTFTFFPEEEATATATYCAAPKAGDLLLEPKAALMKTGAFKLLCNRFGISKPGPSVHLYTAPEETAPSLPPIFKIYRIEEVRNFSGAELKNLGNLYPDAEVSAKNLPLSSEELQRKIGSKGGGPHHIFGYGTSEGRFLIVCRSR